MSNGRQGEILFKQLMEQRGYAVEDVTANPSYWYQDIDFIITSPTTGATKSFEVKWDSRINKTGNLYIETEAVCSKGGQGWLYFCKADYLVYGDAVNRVFYVIPFQEFKERLFWLPKRCARCGNESQGLLVSLKDIEDLIQIIC